MLKMHSAHFVIADHITWNYFYTREKRDANGNSRFRVYIIDPEGPVVYERIFKCYEFQICDCVKNYIENHLEKELEKL